MVRKSSAFLLTVTLLSSILFSSNVFGATITPRQERVLAVLVEFAETTESLSKYPMPLSYNGSIINSDSYYSNLLFGASGNTAKNYYKEVSEQKVDLIPIEETSGTANDGIVRVRLPYPHPNDYIDTGKKAGMLTNSAEKKIIDSILGNKLIDPYVDFSKVEKNLPRLNYGYIDTPEELHLIFVLAGGNSGPSIRAFNTSMGSKVSSPLDNMNFDYSHVSFVNANVTLATLCHEIAHDSSATDIYEIANNNVGMFSLMNKTDINPTHLDPWHKIDMDFVEPTIVETTGTYTVNSWDPNNPGKYNVLMVNVPTGYFEGKEYFLIENRQLKGFDSQLGDTYVNGGIAIWHISEGSTSYLGNIRLEESDFEGYEVNNNTYLNILYSNGIFGKNFFGSNTFPGNSKTYAGKDTGLAITVNSANSDSMSITIMILTAPKNFKATLDGKNTKITWDPVLDATEYEVSIDNGAFFSVGANTSYTCYKTNKHSYRVRAKNAKVTGPASKEIDSAAILLGDINGNGTITIEDFNDLKNYLLGLYPNFTDVQKLASDVNGDGDINCVDSALILKYTNQSITVFPIGYAKIVTYGDVNEDGLVTFEDSDIVLKNQNTISKFSQRVAANVDSNQGLIDFSDASDISHYVTGQIERFIVMDK